MIFHPNAFLLCVFFLTCFVSISSTGEPTSEHRLSAIPRSLGDATFEGMVVSVNGSRPLDLGNQLEGLAGKKRASFGAGVARGSEITVVLQTRKGEQLGTAVLVIAGEPAETFSLQITIDLPEILLVAHWDKRFMSAEAEALFFKAKTGASSAKMEDVISSARIAMDLRAADVVAACLTNASYVTRMEVLKVTDAGDIALVKRSVVLALADDTAWDAPSDRKEFGYQKLFCRRLRGMCDDWLVASGSEARVSREAGQLGDVAERRVIIEKLTAK